jgi:ABC-type antimicrobial peptide transport system permease subunit
VIGRTVRLSDEPYTIVGIMPAHASVASWPPMACDLWVPLALSDEERANRQNHNLEGVARLKRDVELAHAQAEMDAISARLAREFPKSDGRWGAVVIPMQEAIVGNSRTMLLMLLGAVGLVLLIACANVGNLFFTRTLNRRREIAIRSALGAGRGRVFQQLLIEALLLATIGGALGLLVAHVTLLGIFAGAALLLASVGIYAVLSYIVRGRTREIGIRTALGARAADVLRMVIVEGMWPTLVGIAAGTIAALASARVMETLVFGVSASDPLTLAAVAATLAVVALMASLVPAYRALRLDPARVLRAD